MASVRLSERDRVPPSSNCQCGAREWKRFRAAPLYAYFQARNADSSTRSQFARQYPIHLAAAGSHALLDRSIAYGGAYRNWCGSANTSARSDAALDVAQFRERSARRRHPRHLTSSRPGATRRRGCDRNRADYSKATFERERHRHHGCHLVPRRTFAGVRTLGSAILSVLVVGMGASLGREGAPKQAGAVFANFFAGRARLSDEQRRLLVACAAGAGMAAAYGVRLGGALFALEVMRGMLALRYVLPALLTSVVATGVAWIVLPDAPTYVIPSYSSSPSVVVWALLAGPIAGLFSVAYVRLLTRAERQKPRDWLRIVTPVLALGFLGVVSIWFPQLLGNGMDISQLCFSSAAAPGLMAILMILKPAATAMCVRSGVPGGLFTPSLTAGALLGGVLGWAWSSLMPGTEPGLFCLIGAGAVLAATTQGPISTVVLMMELTGRDRSFILPLIIAAGTATIVARTIEPRSIYDARLSEEEIEARQKVRDLAHMPPSLVEDVDKK